MRCYVQVHFPEHKEEEKTRMADKEFVEIVKELRRQLRLSQEKFAAEVGVTASTVNRWENGRGKPSPLAMRRIEELNQNLSKDA